MKVIVSDVGEVDASEMILRGSVGLKQTFNTMYSHSHEEGHPVTGCCLVGAIKLGCRSVHGFMDDPLTEYECPVCAKMCKSAYYLLTHLNDGHRLGFTEAALILKGVN